MAKTAQEKADEKADAEESEVDEKLKGPKISKLIAGKKSIKIKWKKKTCRRHLQCDQLSCFYTVYIYMHIPVLLSVYQYDLR